MLTFREIVLDFAWFPRHRKRYWVTAIVVASIVLATIALLGHESATAPFVYTNAT